MDYRERLRWFALNSAVFADTSVDSGAPVPFTLDARALALTRLAALISIRGAPASYGAHVDAAVAAGATAEEIVDVLVAVVPTVGMPCVVAAAPNLALALGYDLEEAFDQG